MDGSNTVSKTVVQSVRACKMSINQNISSPYWCWQPIIAQLKKSFKSGKWTSFPPFNCPELLVCPHLLSLPIRKTRKTWHNFSSLTTLTLESHTPQKNPKFPKIKSPKSSTLNPRFLSPFCFVSVRFWWFNSQPESQPPTVQPTPSFPHQRRDHLHALWATKP